MLFWKIQKSKKNMLSTSLTLFKSQIVLAKHKCSTNLGDCKSKRGNWSTWRKTSQSRVENQQTQFVFQP